MADSHTPTSSERQVAAGRHCALAHNALQAGDTRRAEQHFLAAIGSDPACAAAHDGLAQMYIQNDRAQEARRHSAAASRLEPHNKHLRLTHADALAASGLAHEAWRLIEPLLKDHDVSHRVATIYARVAPKLGRETEAAAFVGDVLQGASVPLVLRPRLHFAAAALLDRIGRYDEAFEQATTAHQLTRRAHDPQEHVRRVDRQIAYYTPQRLRSLPHATHGSRRPVFIVGMPRSGTSLVEQILSCHSAVFAAGELIEFPRHIIAFQAGSNAYPQCLDAVTSEQVNQVAALYLSAIGSLNSTATHVTDKMPLNCMFLDLVELTFPQAHVIHCTRDPLDTCLSCYLTEFAISLAFTGDLRELGSFYRQYSRLMDHWKNVLSVPMLEVRYEDVVNDLEGQARRMIEFLDLPWEDRCLSFHENRRPVVTASRDQVRRPIYASSIGRWRHYEKHLAGLIAELGKR